MQAQIVVLQFPLRLSDSSRAVILGAMGRCVTGKRRIVANLPSEARVAHKTGSLFNTSSDVGIIQTPDGRSFAVAIYVTGQGTRLNREARIASIAPSLCSLTYRWLLPCSGSGT